MNSEMTLVLQQPLAADVAGAALMYTAEDLQTVQQLHGTDDDILLRRHRTVGQAHELPQSAPHVLVPRDLSHSRWSMPNAGMAHRCYRGTGF